MGTLIGQREAMGRERGRAAPARWARLLSAGVVIGAVVLGGVALSRPPAAPAKYATPLAPSSLGTSDPVLALDTVNGRTYVARDDGRHIDVLDTRTGTRIRTIAVPAPPGMRGSPRILPWMAIDPRTQHLFELVAAGRSPAPPWTATLRVYMIDATRGRVLTSMPAGAMPGTSGIGAAGGTPLVVDARDGRLFVSHFDAHRMSVFDTRDGRLLRTISVGRPSPAGAAVYVDAVAVDERSRRAFVVDNTGGTVTTLDAASGRVVRVVSVGPHLAPPLVDARRGTVTVLAVGQVSVLDAATGRVTHVAGGSAETGFTRAVDQTSGTVVTIDLPDRWMRLRHSATGRLVRTIPLAVDPAGMAVDGRSGHVLVLDQAPYTYVSPPNGPGIIFTSSSRLTVLDEATGATLRDVPVGVGYGQIAVDEAAGRAVVLTTGGPVSNPDPQDPWGWLPARVRRFLPFLSRPAMTVRTAPLTVTFVDTARL